MYPFPAAKLKLLCFLSWCFFFIFSSTVFALDPDIVKVRNAIKEAVQGSSSNIEVAIFGSHVDGKNFLSPLKKGGSSDFDMRLVFKNISPDDAESVRQWKVFREKLREALAKQYPDQGEFSKILNKTNVYPPEELMKGVAGRKDAFQRFKDLDVSPKLSHQSAAGMTEKTFPELGGGLYGETTEKATRQAFESKVGKVIGKDSTGKVREFLADITHQAEGRGFYTVKGSGNAASQWIDDAVDALNKGNPKGIAKNVERAGILLKGKDLARVPLKASDIALRNAAKEMEAILKEFGDEILEGAKLKEFEKRVFAVVSKYGLQDVLKTCKVDAELLKLFGNPKFEGLVANGLLKGVGKWGQVSGALSKLWSKIPDGSIPAVLNVVILAFQAPEQYANEGALKAALESAMGLATIPSAFGPIGWAQLLSTIVVSILDVVTDYFKDRFYEFAAGTQSCSDLIAGRYMVKGRETQAVDPISDGKCHEVQDIEALACYTKDEAMVLRLIECHARTAAKRFESGGAGEKETEKGIIDALMRKCGRDGPKAGGVIQDWMEARERFKGELDNFARSFDGSPLNIEARPDPAEIGDKGAVTVRLEVEIPDFSEEIAKETLQCLGGRSSRPRVYTRYKWGVNGLLRKETSLPYVELDFDKPGVYTIDLAVELDYGSSDMYIQTRHLSKGGRFILPVHKLDVTRKGDKSDDKAKDDKKEKPQPPTVITQPDTYTKGQIGADPGAKGTVGVTPGTADPVKPPQPPSDLGKVGVTPGTGAPVGPVPPVGAPGKMEPTGGQAGITSGISTGAGIGIGTGKTTATTTEEPPACTYDYSGWGECNRGSKTQTRTILGKKPAGCVEKGKPALSQGCEPPPTDEEKRQSYLNCLCACTPFWQSTPWYGSKECGGRGPCESRTFAYGTRLCSFINAKPECAASCYKSAYGKTGDPASIEKDIRDTNRKHKEAVKIKLNQGNCPVHAQLGDIIQFSVSYEGGIPPHKVSWSGNGMAKDNTFTFANSRQPGTHPISVTVTDSDGGSATASCAIIVDAITVEIEKTSPPGNSLPVGGKASFRAIVKSGKNQASGELKYQWQPHPQVQFGDDKNPLFETTSPNTTVTYTRLGIFPMWVEVLKKMGDTYRTIGRSNQIPMTIVKPVLKLSVNKNNPRIGETVIVTVQEDPKMGDDAISFWWEIKGDTANPGPEPNIPNNRAYSFKAKDIKPVTVTVHGKAKDGGDDLGEASATITAQEYEVSIGEPQRRGPKPKIWNPQVWKSPEWKQGQGLQGEGGLTPGGGLIEVSDSQFAVFEDIFVKADVKPTPEKLLLRYDWAIAPSGICGIPGAGQELRLNCSQTGAYTVTLSVRDSDNLVLGKASRVVNITISKEDLDKAKGPLVTLQTDKTSLKTGETAVIKAAAQGGKAPYAYRWGDGVEGKAETARFSPKKSGAQKITVEVTDSAGKKNTANISIKVERAKLEVTLKAAKTDIKLGEAVDIKAEAKGGEAPFTYTWSPDAKAKGDSIPFAAKKGGPQTISVEVTDGAGQKAKAMVELKVAVPKLEVALKADKTTLKTGETVSIQAVVKGGAPPVTSKWSADVVAKGEAASFTPKKSGAHKITVDVSDNAKQTASAAVDLKVEAPKLEVTLKADKTTLTLGETAALQATIKGGEPPLVYQWGSGVEGKGDSGRFVADKPGMRKASLEVSDKAGQKASASVDLKVEVPKLEVALAPDKPTLKVGEKGTIKATVKGGMPDYTYQWSSFVSGKGDQAVFTPAKTGHYKVWLEVKDKTGGKVSASLDWKVEAGVEVTAPSKTTGRPGADPASPSTPATPPVLTGGPPPSPGPDPPPTMTLIIEPKTLSLSSGKSADLKVFTVREGRKIDDVTSQCTLMVSSDSGIRIDRNGRITVEKTARSGAVEPLLATLKHASGVTLRADGIIRIEGAAKPPSVGYDPTTDPGKLTATKPIDLDKVNKLASDFQKGQWNILDSREQKIKDQPPGQPVPPEYLGSTKTTAPPTAPPGGATTPPTAPPTTTTGVTSKDLTDVTVDRRDVTITVWDHGAEDGDIISIYLNGKVIKSKLLLTKKKQSFRVQLTGGQNQFEVEAVNEGSTPPNTATVEISNVTKGKPSQVYERKTGKRASMNLTAP